MMTEEAPSARTAVRRLPQRAAYDRGMIDSILDEALVCHVGFVQDGQPFVIPTLHARRGDRLVLHGSAASRMMRTLAGGVPVCATVSLLDGLVLARSAFHHSVNYRSVVVLGTARPVTDPAEKAAALEALVEHVARGRSAEVRPPNDRELRGTTVLELGLDECSAKVRTGPPVDDEEDYGLPCWAGVLPLRLTSLPPEPDPRLTPGIMPSAVVTGYTRRPWQERSTP